MAVYIDVLKLSNIILYQEHRLLLRGFKKTWILLMDDLFDVKGGKEGKSHRDNNGC